MRKIEVPKLIEPWRIICAAQSEPDYSEERYILIYAGENVWDELLKLAESKIGDSGWYCRCEQRFWKLVVMALEVS